MICPRASRTTLGGRQYRLHNGPEPVREHPITHHPKIITDDPAQEWQTRSNPSPPRRPQRHPADQTAPPAPPGGAVSHPGTRTVNDANIRTVSDGPQEVVGVVT